MLTVVLIVVIAAIGLVGAKEAYDAGQRRGFSEGYLRGIKEPRPMLVDPHDELTPTEPPI